METGEYSALAYSREPLSQDACGTALHPTAQPEVGWAFVFSPGRLSAHAPGRLLPQSNISLLLRCIQGGLDPPRLCLGPHMATPMAVSKRERGKQRLPPFLAPRPGEKTLVPHSSSWGSRTEPLLPSGRAPGPCGTSVWEGFGRFRPPPPMPAMDTADGSGAEVTFNEGQQCRDHTTLLSITRGLCHCSTLQQLMILVSGSEISR